MKIALFDMDGVLLQPGGYHRALQETVRLVSAALGYQPVSLSRDDITAFESAGVYSEWDTSAICLSLLLDAAWRFDPALELPRLVTVEPKKALSIPLPDFQAFASSLRQQEPSSMLPLARTESLLLDRGNHLGALQRDTIRGILRNARALDNSLTHATFQELVLGSQVFADTYQRAGVLDTESFLLLYDRSMVTTAFKANLDNWLNLPDHRAAIFTSRPSTPLSAVFSTPEAELGTKLVGLERLPILGLGGLLWLSSQRQAGAQDFVKPSPVHVLSGLLLATDHTLIESLEAAAALALDGQASPAWDTFHDVELIVFEDSPAGMQSAKSARDCLSRCGISIRLNLYGITSEAQKASSLERQGAVVYPRLSAVPNEW